MPIKFDVTGKGNYFLSIWEGPLSDDEVYRSYVEFYTGDLWNRNLNELVDLSDADFEHITTQGLALLGLYVQNHFTAHEIASSRTAIYSPNDLPYGMARVYEAKASNSPEKIKVFRSKAEALNWVKTEN